MTSKLGDADTRLTVKIGHFNGRLGWIVIQLLVTQEAVLELVVCGMIEKVEKWPLMAIRMTFVGQALSRRTTNFCVF